MLDAKQLLLNLAASRHAAAMANVRLAQHYEVMGNPERAMLHWKLAKAVHAAALKYVEQAMAI